MEASEQNKYRWLAPFIGNDPECVTEHSGYIPCGQKFTDAAYLEVTDTHKGMLAEFGAEVQKAVKI